MYLGNIRLYPLEVYKGENLIFNDMAESLPSELKEEPVLVVELINGKLKIEI